MNIKAKYVKAYEAIKSVINNILAQIEKFTCDVKRYINEALEWIKEIPDYLLEQFVGVGMIDTLEADAKKLLEMVGFFITSMRAAMNDLFENQFNKPGTSHCTALVQYKICRLGKVSIKKNLARGEHIFWGVKISFLHSPFCRAVSTCSN